jgi:hypothetical protein
MIKMVLWLLLLLMPPLIAHADESSSHETRKWHAITVDNDVFVGNDSGYTNGLYYSLFNGSRAVDLKPAWLTRPFQWLIEKKPFVFQYNATTLGQVMMTPSDITISTPQTDDIPYSGLLFFQQTNVKVFDNYSDKVSLTLGIVGPASGAEHTQTAWHKLIGANTPRGWDYQLKNEIVFQVSRGRAWRAWHSFDDNADLIVGGDVKLGTLESSITTGTILRYGRNIEDTYSTAILSNDRTTNPIHVDDGWYIYAGTSINYIANIIYLDGNTFRDSPSLDYDPVQLDFHVGFSYAWTNYSISLALNNIGNFSSDDEFADSREYGSLTFLWRM